MVEIPVYAMIVGTTALVSIGFIVGAYGGRFVTRSEYKESIDRLHERIDEMMKEIHVLCVKVAASNPEQKGA